MKQHSLKRRILLWFGSGSTIVLVLFSLAFNYFLNESINSSIKAQMHKMAQDIDFAIVKENKIIKHSDNFTLKNFEDYLNRDNDFFIIEHTDDDDYIDALYITKEKDTFFLLYKTNIDNKIEEFQDVLLLLVPILLLVLILLASKMIDKILMPINKLIEATNSTSVTKFSHNIALPKENDEIKELVLSFNKMIIRLRNEVESLDRFNSDVSHELKTPLTVIQGEIEITLRKIREPKVYEKSMQTIFEQSKQIQSIVEQLLLLTKYTKENIRESFEICNLDSMLLSCIDKYAEQLKAKNLHLDIKKIEVVSLNASPILINSIFSNLLDNAIKYTPKGKNISIELYQADTIVFTIKDEGIGISEEHSHKITERFYRVDESRYIKGSGLGLSIVKNSVELHEGSLTFDSSLKQGLIVTVNI
ncbi:sensor histidine kinase [Sulfurimonas sp. CS5]|uniref:sensor histidine kinase n=1 Tax=Sulfurimonas sp. CS5 TaxID=3391145 RepID=UPI0039ED75C4